MELLEPALWLGQGFLALFFLAAGAPKVLGRGLERWTGFSELPRSIIVLTGLAEVLGAVALVLPMAVDVLPALTPVAALGLAAVVLMASGFHLREDEHLEAVETSLWASICIVVAIGRWNLVPDLDVAAWVVAALAILVPAVVVTLVLLWRPAPATQTLAKS